MVVKEPIVLRTIIRRPIDCSKQMIDAFFKIVMDGGQVPFENLRLGVQRAEVLFFSGNGTTIMGVGAVRFQQKIFHKHLFEQAGVPEMFNPDSIEVCWISVGSEYRGKGIYKNQLECRTKYLKNRPSHSLQRINNNAIISATGNKGIIYQAGHEFKLPGDSHSVMLMVQNHDPVYNPDKQFWYGDT